MSTMKSDDFKAEVESERKAYADKMRIAKNLYREFDQTLPKVMRRVESFIEDLPSLSHEEVTIESYACFVRLFRISQFTTDYLYVSRFSFLNGREPQEEEYKTQVMQLLKHLNTALINMPDAVDGKESLIKVGMKYAGNVDRLEKKGKKDLVACPDLDCPEHMDFILQHHMPIVENETLYTMLMLDLLNYIAHQMKVTFGWAKYEHDVPTDWIARLKEQEHDYLGSAEYEERYNNLMIDEVLNEGKPTNEKYERFRLKFLDDHRSNPAVRLHLLYEKDEHRFFEELKKAHVTIEQLEDLFMYKDILYRLEKRQQDEEADADADAKKAAEDCSTLLKEVMQNHPTNVTVITDTYNQENNYGDTYNIASGATVNVCGNDKAKERYENAHTRTTVDVPTVDEPDKRTSLEKSNQIFKRNIDRRKIDLLAIYRFIQTRFIDRVTAQYDWVALYIAFYNYLGNVQYVPFSKQMMDDEWFGSCCNDPKRKCSNEALGSYRICIDNRNNPSDWSINMKGTNKQMSERGINRIRELLTELREDMKGVSFFMTEGI